MLRVKIDEIQSGMVLARPIPAPTDPKRHILGRDAEVPSDLVPHLREIGVREIWVRCSNLEFLESLLDEELDHPRRELRYRVRKNFEQVMAQATVGLDLAHFQESIAGMFDALHRLEVGNRMLHRLDLFDDYLMNHSGNVCYLAMLVGMKLHGHLCATNANDYDDGPQDLRLLGLGCLLHDIGKMLIPKEILNKPGRLTPEEFEIMKRHAILGYELLGDEVPAEVGDVVLNHHQRYDGRGYPCVAGRATKYEARPLVGDEISMFSRIATMADIYDAATSKRCYSDAKPPVQVLHEMRTWCRGAFDPVVEQAFYEVIPAFPLGSRVTLSNGMKAVVVDFNSRLPVSPKVQCTHSPDGEAFDDPSWEEIDLAVYPDIQIARVGDVDVSPFLESQRTSVPQQPSPDAW